MSTLTFQPVLYYGKRLEEIAERTIHVYEPFFDDYKIAENKEKSDLPERAIKNLGLPSFFRLDGNELLAFFKNVAKPTIVITDMVTDWGTTGQAYILGNAGYVTTSGEIYKIKNQSPYQISDKNCDERTNLVTWVTVHETGHIIGLLHHLDTTKPKSGHPCPMSADKDGYTTMSLEYKETISEHLKEPWKPEEFNLCEDCYLKIAVLQS